MGFFDKLKAGLQKTKQTIIERVESVLVERRIDESTIDDIEEILITSDLGGKATEEIMDLLREKVREGAVRTPDDVKNYLRERMSSLLGRSQPIVLFGERPFVILTVGVNGVGKTTTIGKLASRFINDGYSVILAAADTFRAAAIEQLEIWASRTGADIIKHQSGADPAAVAFDAVEAAKHRGVDVVIIDTAGRLHTKSPLMEELKKINRVVKKSVPDAPQETLLIVDATTGQNALRQAQIFNEAIGVSGIALTKLDGTAKGGIIFAITREAGIPVRLIGIGEGVDDLKDFDPGDFVKALFEA
ncbi:MAG TPA: signal recognition particle-docking protein FtsY [Dissulfurispiraceae bacterium]|nr:signal recognition particle-docking protein FtsY [Dissulfurispiraceae bacterium]